MADVAAVALCETRVVALRQMLRACTLEYQAALLVGSGAAVQIERKAWTLQLLLSEEIERRHSLMQSAAPGRSGWRVGGGAAVGAAAFAQRRAHLERVALPLKAPLLR